MMRFARALRMVALGGLVLGALAPLSNATAQVPIPVPGVAAPNRALPNDPAPNLDPARPPLTAPQLLDKSVRDLGKGDLGAVVKDDIKALQRGPLLIHGNYCGVGNRPGTLPTDALDAACMRHDACTETGTLPSCPCDQRLRVEALAVAEEPATPPDLKITAAATAAAIAVLVCPSAVPN